MVEWGSIGSAGWGGEEGGCTGRRGARQEVSGECEVRCGEPGEGGYKALAPRGVEDVGAAAERAEGQRREEANWSGRGDAVLGGWMGVWGREDGVG